MLPPMHSGGVSPLQSKAKSRRPSIPITSSQQSTSNTGTAGTSNSRLIIMRKGPQGFGFSIRSVRVYISEFSEYYSIEHIVAHVTEGSPAAEAGLRENDMITHVHTQNVHNMSHPMLMHRLLSCGNELILHVIPLDGTSIKTGEARRCVGKLLRQKPKKSHQRRTQLDKRQRKTSALLRRLSGKRTTGDISMPGNFGHKFILKTYFLLGTKQTFMPRSVSIQEGGVSNLVGASYKPGQQFLTTGEPAKCVRDKRVSFIPSLLK